MPGRKTLEPGLVFNHLTVVANVPVKSGPSLSEFRCRCGSVKTFKNTQVVTGERWHCGCVKPLRHQKGAIGAIPKGTRFNHLTVLHRDEGNPSRLIHYVCLCDCGRTVTRAAQSLRGGHTTSCGCMSKLRGPRTAEQSAHKRRSFQPGERYGRLTVLGPVPVERGKSKSRFRCDCGAEIVRDNSTVRAGATQSCGCLVSDSAKAREQAKRIR